MAAAVHTPSPDGPIHGACTMTQVKIMPILNVSGCPLESRLPSVEGWPFKADADIWRQPNRSLVEAVELLAGKLDRPGAHPCRGCPQRRVSPGGARVCVGRC